MNALAASLFLLAWDTPQEPERVVATHYYYWYTAPEPNAPPPAVDHYRYHFVDPAKADYRDVASHEAEFRAMTACGIDVAWAVYWSAPGFHARWPFGNEGIAPMVEALARIERSGAKAPKLGLFYDTTTLGHEARGIRARGNGADLRTPAGKALFNGTVLEFYAQVPPQHWARLRGGALIGMYASNWAGGWDRNLVPALRAEFAGRFPGERVTVVADRSWGYIGQDLTTEWGAAMYGPRLYRGVAQIGPGFDMTHKADNDALVRDREDGAFYVWSWLLAMRSRPELVVIETWNELYEGTNVCECAELGTRYLELTKAMTAHWRAGTEPAEPTLRRAQPRARADLGWGAASRGQPSVRADYANATPLREGLRERPGHGLLEDGALHFQGSLAFQVSDHWRYDDDDGREVECVITGPAPVGLEYDSEGIVPSQNEMHARAHVRLRDGERWVFWLPRARFANRQEGGCDFRLISVHPVALRSIQVR